MARMSRFLISAAIVGIAVAGNPCGCVDNEFCNFDYGRTSGDCENCNNFNVVDECDADGLPQLGAEDCKARCFADNFEQEEEEQSGCRECVTTFMAVGGCDDFDNDALVPPGCDYCGEAAWEACGKPGDFGQEEEEEEQLGCGECVFKFMAAGGCDDFDNDALIPPGCDAAACGEAAWEACGRPGDNIYGFEDVCVGLKSKKCKKQDTCEYKNKQCVKEKYIDMPVDPMDVCVGLKSKKCKKQDMCEYKNKQCVSIDEPIDVCVGLKSKKCKKQDTCEYKKKQCVSIDEPIDVCVGLGSKKCKKQDTCEYKRKQKQCVMI